MSWHEQNFIMICSRGFKWYSLTWFSEIMTTNLITSDRSPWKLTTVIPNKILSCNALTLEWRHNGLDSVSNHQPHDLLNRLFRHRSKKTSKLCVTGLCEGNSPGTGEFPAQMARNAENVSIWWRHHGTKGTYVWFHIYHYIHALERK